MVFREKSAWLMLVITLVIGGYMASGVIQSYIAGQQLPPVLPVFIKLTVSLIVVSIVGQIVLSVTAIKHAEQKATTYERRIATSARAIAGVVLAVGVVSALMLFVLTRESNLLFYACLGSLVVSQVVEYAVQIVHFRIGNL